MATAKIQPVILCGGAGTRLWPLSRHTFPKQLHALTGERSLLQETALRVSDTARFTAPIVVCNEAHRFAVGEQLAEVGVAPTRIILEPEPKNTAPALAAAALISVEQDGPLFALPSDAGARRDPWWTFDTWQARGVDDRFQELWQQFPPEAPR